MMSSSAFVFDTVRFQAIRQTIDFTNSTRWTKHKLVINAHEVSDIDAAGSSVSLHLRGQGECHFIWSKNCKTHECFDSDQELVLMLEHCKIWQQPRTLRELEVVSVSMRDCDWAIVDADSTGLLHVSSRKNKDILLSLVNKLLAIPDKSDRSQSYLIGTWDESHELKASFPQAALLTFRINEAVKNGETVREAFQRLVTLDR